MELYLPKTCQNLNLTYSTCFAKFCNYSILKHLYSNHLIINVLPFFKLKNVMINLFVKLFSQETQAGDNIYIYLISISVYFILSKT